MSYEACSPLIEIHGAEAGTHKANAENYINVLRLSTSTAMVFNAPISSTSFYLVK